MKAGTLWRRRAVENANVNFDSLHVFVAEKCLSISRLYAEISNRHCGSKLTILFVSRMEETVRSMLQYKARSEQLKQEKTSLTVAYEVSHHCHVGDTPLRHVVNMASPKFCLEDNELETNWGDCRHFRWNSCPLNFGVTRFVTKLLCDHYICYGLVSTVQ
jgi:hypothetical protein